MCSGIVFTTLGMLTKQMLVQHSFRNAADRFRNAIDGLGRPEMGLGLVRECSGGVWTVSRQVGVTRLGWDVTVMTNTAISACKTEHEGKTSTLRIASLA